MARILCVEDNDDNQFMLHRRLSRAGFDVKLARDGAEGVEWAKTLLPDLIVMDLELPEARRLGGDAPFEEPAGNETHPDHHPVIPRRAGESATRRSPPAVTNTKRSRLISRRLVAKNPLAPAAGVRSRERTSRRERREDPLRRGQRRQHLRAQEPARRGRASPCWSRPTASRAWRWPPPSSPDLIIMDLRLPVLDGWEATRRLKAAPGNTAHSDHRALRARDGRRPGEGARGGVRRLRHQAGGAAAAPRRRSGRCCRRWQAP